LDLNGSLQRSNPEYEGLFGSPPAAKGGGVAPGLKFLLRQTDTVVTDLMEATPPVKTRASQNGQTLQEYLVVLAFLAMISLGAITVFGQNIMGFFNTFNQAAGQAMTR
jgi:Flp pilus assembly pilin Flp